MTRDDDFNIISEDDEEEVEYPALFVEGQPCDVCRREEGRVGLDVTCRGHYGGEPQLFCFGCLDQGLRDEYAKTEGIAVVVEPFWEYDHYYYRLDEMPAYQFVREDVEAISWLMLTIGDKCARCDEQSRFAWLTTDFIIRDLPENEPVFRNLDQDIEHLCGNCMASQLAKSYAEMDAPLVTAELPRAAMGVLMPTGD